MVLVTTIPLADSLPRLLREGCLVNYGRGLLAQRAHPHPRPSILIRNDADCWGQITQYPVFEGASLSLAVKLKC